MNTTIQQLVSFIESHGNTVEHVDVERGLIWAVAVCTTCDMSNPDVATREVWNSDRTDAVPANRKAVRDWLGY